MTGLGLTLLLAGSTAGSPVPALPLPDPLGWGYLGVRATGIEELTLAAVEPGTGAERAGLKPGDRVTRAGTIQPRNWTEFASYVSSFRPGAELKIEVQRGSEKKTFVVRLGLRPPEAGEPPRRE